MDKYTSSTIINVCLPHYNGQPDWKVQPYFSYLFSFHSSAHMRCYYNFFLADPFETYKMLLLISILSNKKALPAINLSHLFKIKNLT